MKIDNISVTNSFKGGKLIKKAAPVAVATAASALFAASKKEGVDPSMVIDEYYRNEFALRNKKYEIRGISRFTPEERLEILNHAEEINLYSKAFFRIVNAKNNDNSPRFNANETLMLFNDAAYNIEKYPKLFQKILDVKDDDKPRFSAEDCSLLMGDAETIRTFPKTFNTLISQKISAPVLRELVLRTGFIVEENPQILEDALKQTKANPQGELSVNDMMRSITLIEKENKKKQAEREAELQAEYERAQEEKAQKEEERRIIAKAAAQERAALRAEQLAEGKRIKQEKMEAWDKQVGWISADRIFEKVDTAITNNTPLVLESGEVLPDEMVEKVAKHIKAHSTKARNLINARYDNLQPMFDEKECFNILAEMDTYFYAADIKYMKRIDEDGKPFFTPQQCKELLHVKSETRDSDIGIFMYKQRKYNAQGVIELVKSHYVTTNSYWYPYDKFANEKNEQGEYKYTVSEAIELAKNNMRKSRFN